MSDFYEDNINDEEINDDEEEALENVNELKPLTEYSLNRLAQKTFIEIFTREVLKNKEKYEEVSKDEARLLIKLYYMLQTVRIRMNNQIVAFAKERPSDSHDSLKHIFTQTYILEKEIEKLITIYYKKNQFKWFFEQTVGVGPILSALLMSNIDINKAQTAGAIWRYAGLINEPWLAGEKRPWNSELKTACWKIGQSFIKFADNPNGFYGKIYKSQKALYWERNLNGEHKERAIEISKSRDMNKLQVGKHFYLGKVDPVKMRAELNRMEQEKEATKLAKAAFKLANPKAKLPTYPPIVMNTEVVMVNKGESGLPMLPPGHVDMMASRYAVKMFLSHLYEKWREHENLPIAEPYMIAIKNHTHKHYAPQVAPKKK